MIVKKYVIKIGNKYYSLPYKIKEITRAIIFDDFCEAIKISHSIDDSEVIEICQISFELRGI